MHEICLIKCLIEIRFLGILDYSHMNEDGIMQGLTFTKELFFVEKDLSIMDVITCTFLFLLTVVPEKSLDSF